jgi:cell division protein FtsI (penicillin-binding protein 3)
MSSSQRNRLALLVLTVLVLISIIGVRLHELQIRRCDELRKRIEDQAQRLVEVNATRGSILDRNGEILAVSVATQALYVHPWKVEDPVVAADLLDPLLSISRAEILERLRSDKPFAYLDRFLEPDQVRAIRATDLPFGTRAAFGFLPSSRRTYPRKELAVHVVGFADIDGNGLEGIERRFDETLRGDPVAYSVVRDGRNGWLSQSAKAPERRPHDVVLTLDLGVQHIVESELDRVMREAGARAASAVVLDPSSGEILALANRPAADANRFGKSVPEARINRALVHQYEPGSTFKIVTMAAALEHAHVDPHQLFDCENGVLRAGIRTIHDETPHRLLSTSQILRKSSNIGMVKVARLIEPEAFYRTILDFGFGSETGIELPGEHEGTLRQRSAWSSHSRDSLAFGQEIAVTVLQMASAFAAVANNGVLVPPRVVREARDPDGRALARPEARGRRVISTRTSRALTAMLEGVITRGTGKRARIDGYRLAGKTGTAQKVVDGSYSKTDFVSSFGGFGPLPAPRLVCLVVVDTPRGSAYHGGEVAGPVFRRIMARALARLRVPRDGETLALSRSPSNSSDLLVSRAVSPGATGSSPVVAAGTVPDLTGLSLREAIARLAALGYRAEVDGRGYVRRQHPAPGSVLQPGKSCQLLLQVEGVAR